MACANGIWKIYIYPKDARSDENSLMAFIEQIHPKETRKIETKPGFHRMHEVIQHIGIVSHLNAWRIEVMKLHPEVQSLEDFAALKPTWKELQYIAQLLCINHVASGEISESVSRPPQQHERDKQLENMCMMQKMFLLYEETSYALNYGCGKVKYAAEIRQYLENVHFRYPEGLSGIYIHVKLLHYMEKNKTSEEIKGQKSNYIIPDLMAKGMLKIMLPRGVASNAMDIDNEEYVMLCKNENLEDLERTVEDDGSLEVD
ncbi:hypothetical protein BDQ17DRAFT_1330741 [Cyathus striatus]|nr:hypothetical protein BDQ17DRAFT_1330741 [Cyathus striatus]